MNAIWDGDIAKDGQANFTKDCNFTNDAVPRLRVVEKTATMHMAIGRISHNASIGHYSILH